MSQPLLRESDRETDSKPSKVQEQLQNPFPYFAQATEAASKLYQAQREHLKLSTELRARREAKRAAFLAGATLMATIGIALALFWLSYALFYTGLSPGVVALLCLTVFGALSAVLAVIGLRARTRVGPQTGKNP